MRCDAPQPRPEADWQGPVVTTGVSCSQGRVAQGCLMGSLASSNGVQRKSGEACISGVKLSCATWNVITSRLLPVTMYSWQTAIRDCVAEGSPQGPKRSVVESVTQRDVYASVRAQAHCRGAVVPTRGRVGRKHSGVKGWSMQSSSRV